MLSVPEHLLSIHKNVNHSSRILMGLVERGFVADSARIEDRNVSEITRLQLAAFRDLEIVRGE